MTAARCNIGQTLASELEIIAETHGGRITLSRLNDIGISTKSLAWSLALPILRDRHGAWFSVREGWLEIVPEADRITEERSLLG